MRPTPLSILVVFVACAIAHIDLHCTDGLRDQLVDLLRATDDGLY